MRVAVCNFIEDLSSGNFPLPDAVVERWLMALKECLASADCNVQQAAVSAVTALTTQYFHQQPTDKLLALLQLFLPEVTSNNQQARIGNALALGSMPRFLLTVSLAEVIQQLCTCATITEKTLQWAEARKNGLAALALVCSTVGIASSSQGEFGYKLPSIMCLTDCSFILGGIDEEMFTSVCRTLIAGLEDYTVDSRGDIGAIVRESAMTSIQVIHFK